MRRYLDKNWSSALFNQFQKIFQAFLACLFTPQKKLFPAFYDVMTMFTFRDDSDGLGNSLGGDGVITGDHDDLDTGRSALGHGVRYSGTGRVNHGHEAHEAHVGQGEVGLVGIELETDRVLVRGQHLVAETWTQQSSFQSQVLNRLFNHNAFDF